jgi:hypothetical protein
MNRSNAEIYLSNQRVVPSTPLRLLQRELRGNHTGAGVSNPRPLSQA